MQTLTKTRIGNYLRRHLLGDQPTFRQGFKEGIAFAQKHAPAAQRQWVSLTDEEISDLAINNPPMVHEFARAIEAKLCEKNGGQA